MVQEKSRKLVIITDVDKLFLSEIKEEKLVEELFAIALSSDFIVKHRCYFLLRELGSQHAIPYILKMLDDKEVLEEDILRLIDITSNLRIDTPILLRRLLNSKNPYLIRGEIIALAKNGSVKSLDILLDFATSNRGRIIRRDLFSEVLGYMISENTELEKYIEDLKWNNKDIRGYLRDMELIGPKYKRLSVYPSNDYWAQKVRNLGLEYVDFKNAVENQLVRKSVKRL
jgi:hypothetical protein